ncbi:MAG: hypothetical protein AAFR17_17015, partial [Pseudomonadota bacterium]
MLPMLTGVVLMLAVGMVIQHTSLLSRLAGGGDDEVLVVLNPDQLETQLGSLRRIDVLANDENLQDRHVDRIEIASAPACGQVFVQDGVLQYLAQSECTEFQRLTYRLAGEQHVAPGVVEIRIIGASPGEPVAPASVQAEQTTPADMVSADTLAVNQDVDRQAAVQTPATPQNVPAIGGQALKAPDGDFTAPALADVQVGNAPQLADTSRVEDGLPSPIAPTDTLVSGGDLAASTPRPLLTPQGIAEPAPSGLGDLARIEDAPETPARANRQNRRRLPGAETLAGVAPEANVAADEATAAREGEEDSLAVRATDTVNGLLQPLAEQLDAPAEASLSVARIELDEPRGDLPNGPRFVLNPAGDLPTYSGSAVSRAAPERDQVAALTLGEGSALAPAPRQAQPIDLPSPPRNVGAPANPAPALTKDVDRAGAASTVTSPQAPRASLETARLLSEVPAAPPKPEPEEELAALTPTDTACVVPPALSFDIKSFAQTGLGITAPCDADSVALISYSGISL